MTEGERDLKKANRQLGYWRERRDEARKRIAAEQGFTPCDDCCSGFCSMNCSSAPPIIKELI